MMRGFKISLPLTLSGAPVFKGAESKGFLKVILRRASLAQDESLAMNDKNFARAQ